MKKLKIFILIPFIFFACKSEKKAERPAIEQLNTVRVATLETRSISDDIVASGILSSKSELKLAFKTGGMIKRMYVNEGQQVAAGQLLAELEMVEIDAQVNQAKIGLQKAQRDYDRVKSLLDDQAATQTQFQDVTSALEAAQQQVTAAQFNQKLSKIFAPASGRILRKISDQGELITPFAPALILGTGSSAYIVELGLTDKDIVKIKNGNNATVELDAYPGEKFNATVSQIAQTVNPASGTFEVQLTLSPTNKKLISGFVAKGIIHSGSGSSGLVLPVSAVVESDGPKAVVYLYDAKTHTVSRKEVIIGKIGNDFLELKSGISQNDLVVVQGGGFLSDGEKVKLVK